MKNRWYMCICLLSLAGWLALPARASVEISEGIIPDQYIVVLKSDAGQAVPDVASDMARAYGLEVGHIYQHALQGFSARLSQQRLTMLQNDPRVAYVDPDREMHALAQPPGSAKAGGASATPPPPQKLPTGVDRIDAELNTALQPVDADIAVIDTGVDLDHPDLNVVANVSFVQSKNGGNDDNGHGTHVAGTAAAKNDAYGVVGVAPGARIWAAKVLDRTGRGSWSSVIAGIDWVTAHADTIEVANMSLGGPGTDTASSLRTAIENSVAAGVTYVVAAGNSAGDAQNFVPAAYDAVITVSAIADSDGQPGGNGPATSYGPDDTFATFSNYGQDVDIAAPGVNILSTWKNGGYNTISGTSMATPHVAGAAALFIAHHPGVAPNDVATALTASGEVGGFSGDKDVFPEPLVDAQYL